MAGPGRRVALRYAAFQVPELLFVLGLALVAWEWLGAPSWLVWAAPLASALKAKRLLLLTDVEGVLDRDGQLIKSLTTAEAQALIDDGTISGGMIPKIESCIDVIAEGVEGVVIINGKVPHAVLLELFTEHGAGTLIERRRRKARVAQ